MARQIVSSSAILFILYDPSRRAPASEGDFLGILSLGCAMENMWLMANSLGIGVPYRKLVVWKESGNRNCEAAQCPG